MKTYNICDTNLHTVKIIFVFLTIFDIAVIVKRFGFGKPVYSKDNGNIVRMIFLILKLN